MQIQKAIKLTYDNADDLVYGHYGRRVEVICTNGTVFTGKVGWYAEDMGEDENEWGVCFDDVTDSAGKTLSGYCVEIPHIESVTPLERANTEEEIKRLFG